MYLRNLPTTANAANRFDLVRAQRMKIQYFADYFEKSIKNNLKYRPDSETKSTSDLPNKSDQCPLNPTTTCQNYDVLR